MSMNVPPLKDDADVYAQQLAFDFFNLNYVDWQLVERLSQKRTLDSDDQLQAIRILTALYRHRAKVGNSMS